MIRVCLSRQLSSTGDSAMMNFGVCLLEVDSASREIVEVKPRLAASPLRRSWAVQVSHRDRGVVAVCRGERLLDVFSSCLHSLTGGWHQSSESWSVLPWGESRGRRILHGLDGGDDGGEHSACPARCGTREWPTVNRYACPRLVVFLFHR